MKPKTYAYEHPRPALAVDCVVFGLDDTGLKLLLIERGREPFAGAYALPGGFVRMQETTDEAARRELEEETGLKTTFLEQLYTFSAVERDPRERVVSVAYFALVKPSSVAGGDDAAHARWVDVGQLPALAFDHAEIVRVATERLRSKVRHQLAGFELLPAKFTLGQVQRLYEQILGRALDKRNFRKAILKMGVLDELAEREVGVTHRPSQLYRFNRSEYKRLARRGFNFEL
ncbi:MAG: hydrolase [Myxococcaceae bacterium]|nr:hydrolase [Myxococcaceae bacterium]